MTLLDRPETEVDTPSAASPLWRPITVGAVAGLVSLALLVGPVLLVRANEGRSTGSWQQALGLGAATWLATLGGHVTFDGFTISFVPLLLAAIPVALLAGSWSWLLRRREGAVDEAFVADLLPRRVLRDLALWWIGYAVIVASAVGLAHLGPARPAPLWLAAALLTAPLLAVLVATGRAARADADLLGPRLDGSLLPEALRRALVPALRGVATLLLVGLVVVAGMVALHWQEVRAVQTAVGGGAGAEVAVDLIQLTALPNLAIWAVSFLAGPGFSVVQGASVTWTGAKTGLMPLIPVLAAHPQPATFPWWTPVVALVPIGVGVLIGRRSLLTVARLSSVAVKAKVALTAAALAAVMVGVLDLLGGSALGAYRLADIGAPAAWLVLALAIELGVGALVAVLWDAWRLRR